MIPIETVKTDAFSMDYFRFGRGKETLVILPGLSVQSVMLSADAVAQEYGAFRDAYTVFVFDRRKELPAAYSVFDMAEDTALAMKKIGLHKVFLFGASQGGMIAMTVAIRHPEAVKKLVLCSTAARVGKTQSGAVEEWVKLAKAGKAEDLYLAFGKALYPKEIFEQSRDLLKEAAKSVTPEDLRRFTVLAGDIENFDVTADLQKIACPVLLVGSEDDRVLGAEATREIADRLRGHKDFETHMYRGYGHAVYDTAPDFGERMKRFLDKNRNRLAEEKTEKKIVFCTDRKEWRKWLSEHFETEDEVWFVFPTVASGEQGVSYNDAVEEALCFGWIDGRAGTLDATHQLRRFTPRRKGSGYSQPNIERLIWLNEQGWIHPKIRPAVEELIHTPFIFPEDILEEIQKDPEAWAHYQAFAEPYKRIRIAYIDAARKRPEEFRKRLANFIAKTRENKRIIGYGGIEKYYG